MFSLVALMCLYLGTSNIRKAFATPFSRWANINWMLAVTGVFLVLTGIACLLQALKDYREKRDAAYEKQEKEKQQKKRQFFYDDEPWETDEEDEDTDSAEEDI